MPFRRGESGPPPVDSYPTPGWHTFEILEVRDGPQTDNGPTMRWTLQFVDPNDPKRLLGPQSGGAYAVSIITSCVVSPKSKAGKLIEAALGIPFEFLNLETVESSLLGKRFGGVLQVKESGYPDIESPTALR